MKTIVLLLLGLSISCTVGYHLRPELIISAMNQALDQSLDDNIENPVKEIENLRRNAWDIGQQPRDGRYIFFG